MNEFDKYVNAVKELYPNALVTNQNSEGVYISEDGNGNVIEVNATNITNKITEMDTARANEATAEVPFPMNVSRRLISVLLIAPLSLTIISSVDASAAPISSRPETMLSLSIEPSTAFAWIVAAPVSAITRSPETFATVYSNILRTFVCFMVPLSLCMNPSPSARADTPRAVSPSRRANSAASTLAEEAAPARSGICPDKSGSVIVRSVEGSAEVREISLPSGVEPSNYTEEDTTNPC